MSNHDEPGWVIGIIIKTAHQRVGSCRPKQMKFDELTQPIWGDAADNFREGDRK